MRLIDADKAIYELGVEDEDIYCKYHIEEQPTAYDVDSVVKELEKMKPDIECFDDVEDFEYALKRHNKYIEIVKKGGVK